MSQTVAAEPIALQFDDAEQQRGAALFGMWIFLATEVLFFGGMFVAYTVYHYSYPEAFAAGSSAMAKLSGGFMTVILLIGSLLVALADHISAGNDDPERIRKIVFWQFIITGIMGVLFLSIEMYEWYLFIAHENFFPGETFNTTHFTEEFANLPFGGRSVETFFMLYFCMTGLHAIHMVIGTGLVTVTAFMMKFTKNVRGMHNMLLVVGLYWHFVDIVWFFLYPLFYLVPHSPH